MKVPTTPWSRLINFHILLFLPSGDGGLYYKEGGFMHLFAYGTLMCAELMQGISGCSPPTPVSATLHGYTRRAIQGASYPGVFLDTGGLVQGCLYQDLPDCAWVPLDRFEGEMYARQQVQVALEDGTQLLAEVYVVRPEFLHYLDTMDWDFATFLARYKGHPGISLACQL